MLLELTDSQRIHQAIKERTQPGRAPQVAMNSHPWLAAVLRAAKIDPLEVASSAAQEYRQHSEPKAGRAGKAFASRMALQKAIGALGQLSRITEMSVV